MFIESVKNGILSGLKTSWFLIKVIVPVYLCITIFRHTPAMDWLVSVAAPFMGVFHLPGEAAVPFIAGIVLDEYGVIASIKAVSLTGYSVTLVAVMTLVSHSIVVEMAILNRMELSAVFFTAYRLFFSAVIGFALSAIGVVLNIW